ncbi:hypothetical protein Igag_0494 [Ignisphaera aggregans DSM 17230]|uniref:DUF5615 domain-containing protein n=1 Tax=Ignisphaera aggregans (strain DSM 17230 / JCM 13409 / AQ1.S1) TaxID=583356 RepID=E0SRY2_IGNAA|nr:hypothetical protein Igag_0494 [Ignisphaera aggregans DSM 17230]
MSRQRLRLLLDENIGLRVYEELKRRGYEVQIVIEELCSAWMGVLRIALNNDKIVVTMDKDLATWHRHIILPCHIICS